MFSNIFLIPLGPWEIIAILLVILVFFGGRKIPELARGLGKGIREFNSAKASIEEEIRDGMKVEEKKKISEKNENG